MDHRHLFTAALLVMTSALVHGCAGHGPKPASGGAGEGAASGTPAPSASAPTSKTSEGFIDAFNVDKARLGPTGRGRYWVLEPGRVATYKGEEGETLTITVLDETKVVDGVTTRVVEEREEKNGKLVEVSRNYLAIEGGAPARPRRSRDDGPEAPATGAGTPPGGEGAVYYFGEDVDIYKDGKVVNHEGAWLSGVNGARFGLLVPGGAAKVGDRFQQETAPGVAMDRGEVVATTELLKVSAGAFESCLHIKETTPLEKGAGHKWYAPNVGLVKDDEMELVSVTRGGAALPRLPGSSGG